MKFASVLCLLVIAVACFFASSISAQASGPPVVNRICTQAKCDKICEPQGKRGQCKDLKICDCVAKVRRGPPVIDRICTQQRCDKICKPQGKKGHCQSLKNCQCV